MAGNITTKTKRLIMKRYYIAILATAIAFTGCRKEEKTAAPAAPAIEVAEAVTDSVTLHTSYPGTLSANRTVQLVARVDGYLTSKTYNSGDRVKKGTVLFTFEDRNYRDAVTKAEAALSTARAEFDYASSRYAAMTRALESDAVSKMEVEEARSNMEQARASIKQAEAALQTARTQLSYCVVRAPFDGKISSASYDVGAYVAGEGAPVPLATIYSDEVMTMNFAIDDAGAISRLKQLMSTDPALLDSIPMDFSQDVNGKYTASLCYIAPNVDVSTGTLTVQAHIKNPDGELSSGMYATIDLPEGVAPHAVLVKDAAISSDQLGKYLYVVNDSNKVVYTPVKVGQTVADTMRIINSGIEPGQRYVTKALLKVRNGMTVNPVVKP